MIRQFSQTELEGLQSNKWDATVFMNQKTFTEDDLKYYPYDMRRTYSAEWDYEGDIPETETIYATDEENLLKYIDSEYIRRPDYLYQVITQYRPTNK
jgi:hypothetical protein